MTHDLHGPCVLLGGLSCDWNRSAGALRDSGGYASGSCQCSICQCRSRCWGFADGAFTKGPSPRWQRAHLGRFVRHEDALSSRDGVLHVLGMVVSLHTDQVAWRSHLAWKGHLSCHQMLNRILLLFITFYFFNPQKWSTTTKTNHRWTRGSAHGWGSVSPLRSRVQLSCTPAWLGRQRPAAGWSGL